MSPRRVVHVAELEHRSPLPVAARIGRLVLTSAITGRDDRTHNYPHDLTEQVANAFGHLRLLLDELGAHPDDVLHVRVYLNTLADREHLNVGWEQMFPDLERRPARHVVLSDIRQFNDLLRMQLEVTLMLPGVGTRLARRLRPARTLPSRSPHDL